MVGLQVHAAPEPNHLALLEASCTNQLLIQIEHLPAAVVHVVTMHVQRHLAFDHDLTSRVTLSQHLAVLWFDRQRLQQSHDPLVLPSNRVRVG